MLANIATHARMSRCRPSGKSNYGCGVIAMRHSRQCLNQSTDSVRDVADLFVLPDA